MPSYKDDKNNTWYCKFYYTDWTGKKRQKLKRGFKLQREAKEWERIFLEQFAKSPDITFTALYEKYKAYYIPRVKESTAATKLPMIEKHILPFFKNKILSDIAPADIAEWQNEILSKNLSDTYMNQLNIGNPQAVHAGKLCNHTYLRLLCGSRERKKDRTEKGFSFHAGRRSLQIF